MKKFWSKFDIFKQPKLGVDEPDVSFLQWQANESFINDLSDDFQ